MFALVGTIVMAIYLWDRPLETFLHARSGRALLELAEFVSVLGLPLPYVGLGVTILLFWTLVLVNTEFKIVERILPYRALFIILGTLIPWFAAAGLRAILDAPVRTSITRAAFIPFIRLP